MLAVSIFAMPIEKFLILGPGVPGMGMFFTGGKEFCVMESTGYMYNECVKPGNLEDKGR